MPRRSADVDGRRRLRRARQDEADRIFFPERGQKPTEARAFCARCTVRQQCVEYALADSQNWPGVWGGLSATERRALRPKGRRISVAR